MEKVEKVGTSYVYDHMDKQDNLCIHRYIGEVPVASVEELYTGCHHGHMDLLCQATC